MSLLNCLHVIKHSYMMKVNCYFNSEEELLREAVGEQAFNTVLFWWKLCLSMFLLLHALRKLVYIMGP